MTNVDIFDPSLLYLASFTDFVFVPQRPADGQTARISPSLAPKPYSPAGRGRLSRLSRIIEAKRGGSTTKVMGVGLTEERSEKATEV